MRATVASERVEHVGGDEGAARLERAELDRAGQPGRTAFVLAGGGSLGAVQVGMLYALLEAGVCPDLIVGSSVGALNGAHLAGHPSLEGVDQLAGVWEEVRRRDIFPLSLRRVGLALMGRRNHLVDPLGLRTWILRADVGFSRVEDAVVPFLVVATDVETGLPVVISEGDTVDALMASAAMPGIFPPVEIDGRALMDGGIAADAPVVQAADAGATTIYLLPTMSGQERGLPRGATDMVFRAMTVMTQRATETATADVEGLATLRVVPCPPTGGHSVFDFNSTRTLIRDSYELASAWTSRVLSEDAEDLAVGA